MPWFYFHLRGPEGLEQDDTGLEFASLEAAYLEAYRTVPGVSAELALKEANPIRYAFEITDESNQPLLELPFAEVLDRRRKPVAPRSASNARDVAMEMARTAYLISAIREQQEAVWATLAETKRLLSLSRTARSGSLNEVGVIPGTVHQRSDCGN